MSLMTKDRQNHAVEETKGVFHSACCARQGSVSPDWQACWQEGRAVLHGTTILCLPVPPLPAHLISLPTCLPVHQIQSSFFRDIPCSRLACQTFLSFISLCISISATFSWCVHVCILYPFTWGIKKPTVVKDCISNSFCSFLTTIR